MKMTLVARDGRRWNSDLNQSGQIRVPDDIDWELLDAAPCDMRYGYIHLGSQAKVRIEYPSHRTSTLPDLGRTLQTPDELGIFGPLDHSSVIHTLRGWIRERSLTIARDNREWDETTWQWSRGEIAPRLP